MTIENVKNKIFKFYTVIFHFDFSILHYPQ